MAERSLWSPRAVMLEAQGLLRPLRHRATKNDVLAAIRRMGAVQLDTIHVVARSQYLVLWSRLGDYRPEWLDELLAEGRLFEYWSHAACLLPIEDLPHYRHRMLAFAARDGSGRPRASAWIAAHRDEMERVLALVRERGEARSADFDRPDGHHGGWWNWKPAKRALEMLHSSGELMIARRERFQRVYAPRERILPNWDDAQLPPLEESRRALALKATRALGIATARWIADYFRTGLRGTAELLESLADDGELIRATVPAWGQPAYLHPEFADIAAAPPRPTATTLLSPFDPLVWDRQRARQVFSFDYTIECYTPKEKRKFGYFCLPILRRGRLVGRLDAKAHRSAGTFQVRSLHLEPSTVADDGLARDVGTALGRCARWHRTPRVEIERAPTAELAQAIERVANDGARTDS